MSIASAAWNVVPIGASDPNAGQDQVTHTWASCVATRDVAPEWLKGVVDRIIMLKGLQENWDSYGARPVDLGAVERAVEVIRSLAQFEGVATPTVTATPDGDVGFCWDDGDWSLDVSVDRTGLMSYVYLDERAPDRECENRTRYVKQLIPFLTQK